MLTSTPLQTSTYLLGVCLASISFVVFVSSTSSFLVRDLVGVQHGVGDLVGTLGFVDELVALVLCPVWGILSDRIGVRSVCVLGYAIIGASLFLTTRAKNVYPHLLLARVLFSFGGSATSTMITAILPSMVASPPPPPKVSTPLASPTRLPTLEQSHSTSPSVSSELTITPARLATAPRSQPECRTTEEPSPSSASPPRVAGLVGVFTGCGALVALALFLPLPTRFSQLKGVTPAQALADSYYVVGGVALVTSLCCLFGLRKLRGEESKGWHALRGIVSTDISLHGASATKAKPLPYTTLFYTSVKLGFTNPDIGLAYLGGFVARASSVGISLFIPLFVSAYFHSPSSGLCTGSPTTDPTDRASCRRAYVLAAELTGTTQLTALLFSLPLGYLSSSLRSSPSSSSSSSSHLYHTTTTSSRISTHNLPLLVGALIGLISYTVLPHLSTPEIAPSRGGSPLVLLVAAGIGISQISAIVCSLGLLGSAVLHRPSDPSSAPSAAPFAAAQVASLPDIIAEETIGTRQHGRDSLAEETAPLLPGESDPEPGRDRALHEGRERGAGDEGTGTGSPVTGGKEELLHLKGSLAGTYSLAGGAGILLLTKLGGWMFDHVSRGGAFYLLAGFDAVLLGVGVGVGVGREVRARRRARGGGR